MFDANLVAKISSVSNVVWHSGMNFYFAVALARSMNLTDAADVSRTRFEQELAYGLYGLHPTRTFFSIFRRELCGLIFNAVVDHAAHRRNWCHHYARGSYRVLIRVPSSYLSTY